MYSQSGRARPLRGRSENGQFLPRPVELSDPFDGWAVCTPGDIALRQPGELLAQARGLGGVQFLLLFGRQRLPFIAHVAALQFFGDEESFDFLGTISLLNAVKGLETLAEDHRLAVIGGQELVQLVPAFDKEPQVADGGVPVGNGIAIVQLPVQFLDEVGDGERLAGAWAGSIMKFCRRRKTLRFSGRADPVGLAWRWPGGKRRRNGRWPPPWSGAAKKRRDRTWRTTPPASAASGRRRSRPSRPG